MIKQECLCPEDITNPRKAIENRKALQEHYDTSLKTCPLMKQQSHHRKIPGRKGSPKSTHFVMKRPQSPPPASMSSMSNSSCSPKEKFSTPVQESLGGCTPRSPCRSPTCSRPGSSCRSPSPSSKSYHSSKSPSPKCESPKSGRPATSKSPSPKCSPPPKCSPAPQNAMSCSPKVAKGACDLNSPESDCAKLKAERMQRFAIGFAIGSLLLLLLYWNFRKSILKTLGLSDGSEDADLDGVDDMDGMGGGGLFGGGGRANAMSLYRRNLLSKRGQICWFNLPCWYDVEEKDWVVSGAGGNVQRHNKLHL